MHELITKVKKAFNSQFNYAPTHIIQAPGRVNLIGEHTDYNDGFVLPCAIDYQTIVAAAKRDDNQIRLVALDYDGQRDQFYIDQDIQFIEHKMWANYIRGVIVSLKEKGYHFKGFDLCVTGNVPQGAGLSSSAALEVVIGQTIKALYSLPITQAQIALIGQQSENQFVGCHCGIMDQMISAQGQKNHAMLLDCRSLDIHMVSMPQDVAVMIINSNKKRGLVDSEYNTRRLQCEQAAAILGVKALRDVTMEQFEQQIDKLDFTVAKRARHVISENARTLEAAKALAINDIEKMGQLMAQSHVSMRDDFAITVPEIDTLVDLIKGVIGHLGGVRMTGGGFGGCVVALVPVAMVDEVKKTVASHYYQATGLKESIYVCHAQDGAGVVENICV